MQDSHIHKNQLSHIKTGTMTASYGINHLCVWQCVEVKKLNEPVIAHTHLETGSPCIKLSTLLCQCMEIFLTVGGFECVMKTHIHFKQHQHPRTYGGVLLSQKN